ncbi:hypothetical protein AAY473_031983, partial [Plecturocebus cupreus]
MRSHFVVQDDLKLLASNNPLASAFLSVGITGVSYYIWLIAKRGLTVLPRLVLSSWPASVSQ